MTNKRGLLKNSPCKQMLLVRQALSALCSAAGKNLAAVSVSHSLAETVLHLAMTLLGLVSSFHSSNLRFTFEYPERLKLD